MHSIRVAAVTCPAIVGDIEGNMARTVHWTGQAKQAGAELVCFPELNLTGYGLEPWEMNALAQPIPGPLTEELGQLARDTNMIILAGLAEQNPAGSPFISHCVVQPEGGVSVYRKLHLSPHEMPVFSKGDAVLVFESEKITWGIQLCYDGHFPELSAAMREKGADVIFLPHASPRTNAQIKHQSWMRHLPARAFDYAVFVVACNQWGDNQRGLYFPGNAVILDPSGNILEKKVSEEEQMIIAELTEEALAHVRNHPMRHFFPNRRPELYRQTVLISKQR